MILAVAFLAVSAAISLAQPRSEKKQNIIKPRKVASERKTHFGEGKLNVAERPDGGYELLDSTGQRQFVVRQNGNGRKYVGIDNDIAYIVRPESGFDRQRITLLDRNGRARDSFSIAPFGSINISEDGRTVAVFGQRIDEQELVSPNFALYRDGRETTIQTEMTLEPDFFGRLAPDGSKLAMAAPSGAGPNGDGVYLRMYDSNNLLWQRKLADLSYKLDGLDFTGEQVVVSAYSVDGRHLVEFLEASTGNLSAHDDFYPPPALFSKRIVTDAGRALVFGVGLAKAYSSDGQLLNTYEIKEIEHLRITGGDIDGLGRVALAGHDEAEAHPASTVVWFGANGERLGGRKLKVREQGVKIDQDRILINEGARISAFRM